MIRQNDIDTQPSFVRELQDISRNNPINDNPTKVEEIQKHISLLNTTRP